MKKIKSNKAITLIALVITIIVLLIIAGVSVAMLTGENGILGKATIAKEKTKEAEDEENKRLEDYNSMIDQYYTRSGNQDPENPSDEVTALKNRIQELEAANSYSTTQEIPIGKWVDGKTIYRKTVLCQCPTYSSGTYAEKVYALADIGIINKDKIINVYGKISDVNKQDGDIFFAKISTFVDNIGTNLYIRSNNNTVNGKDIYVVLEYTK